jgi:hypothetical protein
MNNIEKDLKDALDNLIDDEHPDYSSQPIPCELDYVAGNLVNLYKRLSPVERETVHSLASERNSYTLLTFAERMATLAVREKSRERLLDGLLSLIIENYNADWRDNLTKLAPLYHSAVKIGIDPQSLFMDAASYGNNEVAEIIRGFPLREPEDRSLEAFGYKESYELDGFRYKWG